MDKLKLYVTVEGPLCNRLKYYAKATGIARATIMTDALDKYFKDYDLKIYSYEVSEEEWDRFIKWCTLNNVTPKHARLQFKKGKN